MTSNGKLVVLDLGTSISLSAKAKIRQKLKDAGFEVSAFMRRESVCLITTKELIDSNSYKVSEARKMNISIIAVDEIDQIIQDSRNNSIIDIRSSQAEMILPPPAIPIKLPEPVSVSVDPRYDIWSFPAPEPCLMTVEPPNPAWKPPSLNSGPVDSGAIQQPESGVKTPRSCIWKTRSTFVATAMRQTDLALVDVENRILAILNAEDSSVRVEEALEDLESDSDSISRLRFVDPDVTFCEVVKRPARSFIRKNPKKSKSNLLEVPSKREQVRHKTQTPQFLLEHRLNDENFRAEFYDSE